jgi:hypothetical protein
VTARSIEETFDATCREMSAAIGRGDLSGALSARLRAASLRDRAERSGIDVEEDGGWMVPAETSVREQVAAKGYRAGEG